MNLGYQIGVPDVPPIIQPAGGEVPPHPAAQDSVWGMIWRSVGWLLFVFLVASVLTVPWFFVASFTGKHPNDFSQWLDDLIANPVFLAGAGASSCAGFLAVGWWRIKAAVKVGRPLPELFKGSAGRAAMIGLLAGLAVGGFNQLSSMLLGWLAPTLTSSWDPVVSGPFATQIVFLLIGAVTAPLGEEIFFRGYVFGMFKRAQRVRLGMVFSAVLFALCHERDAWSMPFVFLLGLTAAWAYHRTGSLLAAMCCHATNNLLAFSLALGS